jgi:hypothetical protein
MDGACIAPQAEKGPKPGRESIDGGTPSLFLHHYARPGAMGHDPPAVDLIVERRHRSYPNSLATF